MTTQACPNCSLAHDVGVYVSGQKIICSCGIRFEVVRKDVVWKDNTVEWQVTPGEYRLLMVGQ